MLAALVAAGCAGQASQPAPDYTRLVASPDRSDADRTTDARRKPVQMLEFYGVRPGMRVLTSADGFPELPSCRIGLVRNAHETSALADALAEHIVSSLDNLSDAQAAAE